MGCYSCTVLPVWKLYCYSSNRLFGVDKPPSFYRTTPNKMRVKFDVTFGSVERNKLISHTRQRRTIIQVKQKWIENLYLDNIFHKIQFSYKIIKYGSFRFPMHDIALAKLDRRIQISEFVRPVCLPNGEIPKDGTRCYSTGFGVTGEIMQPCSVPYSISDCPGVHCRFVTAHYTVTQWLKCLI